MKKLKFKYAYFYVTAVLTLCTLGCSSYNSSGDQEEVNIKVDRYDLILKDYVEVNSYSSWTSLSTDYYDNTRLLVEDVLSIDSIEDPNVGAKIRDFYADNVAKKLMDDAIKKYVDMSRVEASLTRAFSVMKDLLPNVKIPHVYTMISGLNQSVVVSDTLVGISLDKYMGTDYPLYKTYFYNYQIRAFTPDRMVPDCIYNYLTATYPLSEKYDKFYQVMLYEGKMHWITTRIVETPDFGKSVCYSEANIKWCDHHLDDVWNNIKTRLRSDDPTTIRNYMYSAPCNPDFGLGSPDKLGVWVGMQIIDAYMQNNSDVTIEDLLNENNYDKIMNDTGVTSLF